MDFLLTLILPPHLVVVFHFGCAPEKVLTPRMLHLRMSPLSVLSGLFFDGHWVRPDRRSSLSFVKCILPQLRTE
jgi:hypothetical protein